VFVAAAKLGVDLCIEMWVGVFFFFCGVLPSVFAALCARQLRWSNYIAGGYSQQCGLSCCVVFVTAATVFFCELQHCFCVRVVISQQFGHHHQLTLQVFFRDARA
jgi:hypothetical protein